jgi:protein O-GlcNAc transferase
MFVSARLTSANGQQHQRNAERVCGECRPRSFATIGWQWYRRIRMNRKQRPTAENRRGGIDRIPPPEVAGSSIWITHQLAIAFRHYQTGQLVDAEALCRRILSFNPNHVDCLHLLGIIAHQSGRNDEANRLIMQALALAPDHAQAHNSLGAILNAQGRSDDAAIQWRRVLALDPHLAAAHDNLGNLLRDQGKIQEALVHLECALAIKPNYAKAHHDLANTLRELGKSDEAVGHYEQALKLSPNSPELHHNLGTTLLDQGKREEAAAQYEHALMLRPDWAEAHMNLGTALYGQGKHEEAVERFNRALELDRGHAGARWGRCMAQLRMIYMDEQEIAQQRAAYEHSLSELCDSIATWDPAIANPYFLAYQGCNDRDLQSAYGSLACRVMRERYPPAALAPPPKLGEPLRLGMVSGFFRLHSVWKMRIKGWLSQLDRSQFQIYGYHTRSERDAETNLAVAHCHRFVQGPLPLDEWRRTILHDAPHVLIYPEVGMDPTAASLAAQRLSPVQCMSWSHPETSGFPTLDYFLSNELMEPYDGQDHYTERLVRLPNLGVYYEPITPRLIALNRTELGLRSTATVYWCSQMLYKYLPQFDWVFPRIAREVADCQFIFILTRDRAHINKAFRKRIEDAFLTYGLRPADHLVILPRLSPEGFFATMGQCDIVLDSIGWSGCNTTLESLGHDLPIVTVMGKLMRGRHTGAILQMMGVPETIVRDLDEYISMAVRLARDESLRLALKAKISAKKHRVYRDRTAIAALEDFLNRVARVDGKGNAAGNDSDVSITQSPELNVL